MFKPRPTMASAKSHFQIGGAKRPLCRDDRLPTILEMNFENQYSRRMPLKPK
jgi:hypothetical protein